MQDHLPSSLAAPTQAVCLGRVGQRERLANDDPTCEFGVEADLVAKFEADHFAADRGDDARGTGASSSCIKSGSPQAWMRMAFIEVVLCECLEPDRSCGRAAVAGTDKTFPSEE